MKPAHAQMYGDVYNIAFPSIQSAFVRSYHTKERLKKEPIPDPIGCTDLICQYPFRMDATGRTTHLNIYVQDNPPDEGYILFTDPENSINVPEPFGTATLTFGVRVGCCYGAFEHPVIAIGITPDPCTPVNIGNGAWRTWHCLLQNASRVIRTSTMTLAKLQDPYENHLACNWEYVAIEYAWLQNAKAKGQNRTCAAAIVNPLLDLEESPNGLWLSGHTKVPWLSEETARLFRSAKSYADQNQIAMLDSILANPVRNRNTAMPVIMDRKKQPVHMSKEDLEKIIELKTMLSADPWE